MTVNIDNKDYKLCLNYLYYNIYDGKRGDNVFYGLVHYRCEGEKQIFNKNINNHKITTLALYKREFPKNHLTYVCGSCYEKLYKNNDIIDTVEFFNKPRKVIKNNMIVKWPIYLKMDKPSWTYYPNGIIKK